MFLAHFASTPLHVLEEELVSSIVYWYNAAVKVWNKMHPKSE